MKLFLLILFIYIIGVVILFFAHAEYSKYGLRHDKRRQYLTFTDLPGNALLLSWFGVFIVFCEMISETGLFGLSDFFDNLTKKYYGGKYREY